MIALDRTQRSKRRLVMAKKTSKRGGSRSAANESSESGSPESRSPEGGSAHLDPNDSQPRSDPAGTSNPHSDPADFEDAMADARAIVARLESGDVPLAEALLDYERGIGRLRDCQQILETAEAKVNLLSGFDADGNPVITPMPPLEEAGGTTRRSTATKTTTRKSSQTRSRSNRSPGGGRFDDDLGGATGGGGDLDDAAGLF